MKSRVLIFSLVAACLAATLVGCGSSSKPSMTPQVSIALSAVPSSIAEGASTDVFAVVTNDTNNDGVTWSVSCGGSSCGTLNNPLSNSVLYSAPPTVVSGTVTLTATSVADSSVTATASFNITPATTLGDGTYVFSLAGEDFNGIPYHAIGAFAVSGGMVTNGEQDFVDGVTITQENQIGKGTIKTSKSTGNTQINLNLIPNSNGFGGTVETLDATMINGVHALVIEFDGSATSSGTIDMQTSAAAPAGGYAFILSGLDSSFVPAAIGGVLNIDTTNGLDGTGSVFDVNDGFNVTQDQPVDPGGTISTTDPLGLSFGRVTIDLVLQNSGFGGLGLVGYVVDANHMALVENTGDPNDTFFFGIPGSVGGSAVGQGTNAGSFTAASPSVAGASYVLGTNGMDTIGPPYQVAGIVTLNSDLSATATLNFNDLSGSAPTTPVQFTGTYTIDPTGRVTLNNLTDPTDTYIFSFQMYLDGNGNATVMSIDEGLDEVAGLAAQQTGGGSFSASSFSGSYGLDVTGWSSGLEMDEVGPVAADGTSALSGAVDQNSPFLIGETSNVPLSGTFTAAANGVFTDGIMGLDVTLGPAQMDVFNYYLIDATRAVAIETDTNQLTLGYFELKQ